MVYSVPQRLPPGFLQPTMNADQFDLNLLRSLDVLLRECNVSRAAEKLNVSQPAMSNSLKRLREYFNDPLFIRTTSGMVPTEKALALEPMIRQSLSMAEAALVPSGDFDPANSNQVFRLLVSDYVEGTLISSLVAYLQAHAPGLSLDILTLSDGSFQDLEKGAIDLAINRFDMIPQSFHQRLLWQDSFSCLVAADHPLLHKPSLPTYLDCAHIWVSKTGIGVGTGMSQSSERGWVDDVLSSLGHKRTISVFTRHYQIIPALVRATQLVATVPTRAALLFSDQADLVFIQPPFTIPAIEVKMVWSSVLHHNASHQWIRQTLVNLASHISASSA
ncbi:MAG: LysR family transcriptional regulator [Pseudomonadota bacterium]